MATKYAQEIPMNSFEQAEQLIHSTFQEIIRATNERKNLLLVQLFDLKQDYLRKENTRKKQVADLEELIQQVMKTNIQQNRIRKVQERQPNNLEEEKMKSSEQTLIPFPSFYPEGLDSLLGQLKKLGFIQDTAGLYNNKTNPIRRIAKPGTTKGALYDPLGLALGEDKIYIADRYNNRIHIFSTVVKLIHEFGKGQLDDPYGIALNKEWVFISDYSLNAIFKFSKATYKLIKSVKEGVSYPRSLTTDTNGEVLVADSNNNRIAIFSSDLEYIQQVGKDKLRAPRDVKINYIKIFVADNNEINNIHIFSKSDDLLKSFIN
ncbi:RING finger protein nhl-1-like [Oopsacas minuta]|uniref:RING finger protein nhl-1-like n=1 Tax=Oopsacas minuta TaxID=111878 RepID=A0AAV7K3J5_9METZ|nr:RING finger protein nhl-1-like [Oopsacas minuta]